MYMYDYIYMYIWALYFPKCGAGYINTKTHQNSFNLYWQTKA